MRVPILMYHAVLPVERTARIRGTVPLDVFREQVEWLARRRFESVSLDAAADLLEGRRTDVRHPVVLTFDDGYECVTEHALPVLEAHGLVATLFVVTGSVGAESHWYAHKGGEPFRHADWPTLERARSRGFEVGSHAVHHQRLGTLAPAERVEEVARSREEIAKRLGRCAHFAYPYGDAPPDLASALEAAGYRTACTTASGPNRPGQALLALRREGVSRTTTPARFRRRLGGWW